MIALDTNLLVYAFDRGSPDHAAAREAVTRVVESPEWALPWSVVHEYLRVVTRPPRGASRRVPLPTAIDSVDALLAAPGVQLLAEPAGYWSRFQALAARSDVTGRLIFDARIAATCLAHGVSELWTADKDFGRFPELRTRNPLVG